MLREDQIYGIAGEKVSKKSKITISSQNISNPVKKDAINSVSNIISGVNSILCSTAKPSTETSLSTTASTKASSSSQLTDIPDQPLTRVYDIDSHSITSTLSDATEGSNHIDSSLGVSHKQDSHNKNRYSRGLHGSNLTSQVLGKSSQRNDISTNVIGFGAWGKVRVERGRGNERKASAGGGAMFFSESGYISCLIDLLLSSIVQHTIHRLSFSLKKLLSSSSFIVRLLIASFLKGFCPECPELFILVLFPFWLQYIIVRINYSDKFLNRK